MKLNKAGMTDSLFEAKDYKSYLNERLRLNASIRGYQAQLAKAAGVGRSFLSQVVRGAVHLTPDHALAVSNFWGLNEDDATHFLDLVLLARSASPQLKSYLQRRIDRRRRRRARLLHRLKSSDRLPEEAQASYYTSWELAAVHCLLSIPEYQSEAALGKRLRLPPRTLSHCIRELERFGIIRSKASGWEVLKKRLFLPEDSPLARSYHCIWRSKAVTKLQVDLENSFHFTTLYALSKRDIRKLRIIILNAIEQMEQTVVPSMEEELVCFACDLFTVE